MSILIGADIVPTKTNTSLFESGDVMSLVGSELFNILMNADYRIFNLETPITDKRSPIIKNGANFIASTKCIVGIREMRIDLLSLANNHIMDQGPEGLTSTIDCIKNNGIAFLGVGKDLFEAKKTFQFDINGKRIGVYSCTEHEYSTSGINSMGANPFDCLESFDHIEELSKTSDYTIVLYHGGKEYYRYPSPNLRKVCRRMIEKGANLVICQHSHCVGCEENYGCGKIVYGQGNFIFDCDDNECFQNGLLVEITEEFQVQYIPFVKHNNGVCLAREYAAKEIMEGFYKRSAEIKSEQFVRDSFNALSDKMFDNYMYLALGYKSSLVFRFLNKVLGPGFVAWFMKSRIRKINLIAFQNIVECETHREFLIQGIKSRRLSE